MNILIDMPVHESMLKALQELPEVNVTIVNPPEEKVRALPTELIESCDALLCTFPPENHNDMLNLKYLQISSAGFNQVVGQGFKKRNVSTI